MHKEELHNFYSSTNNLGDQIRGERRAELVALMGRREIHVKFLLHSLKGRDH
jgi:hypothetical protein